MDMIKVFKVPGFFFFNLVDVGRGIFRVPHPDRPTHTGLYLTYSFYQNN